MKSFLNERTAVIKQEQLLEIFNAQSDAILVVEAIKEPMKLNSELQSEIADTPKINVKYSNTESISLLECNLQDA